MRHDVELADGKGAVSLCDLAALTQRPSDAEELFDREGCDVYARPGQLFYVNPLDFVLSGLAIFVDESLPPYLDEHAYASIRRRLLHAPSGEIVVDYIETLAANAAPERLARSQRIMVEPGDYVLDAYLLAYGESENDEAFANVPEPPAWAQWLSALRFASTVWFMFCSLCYVGLIFDGLARETLPLFLKVGVGPVALTTLLFFVTGARRRYEASSAAVSAVEATLPRQPSVAIVLSRKVEGDGVVEGGGIDEHDFDAERVAFCEGRLKRNEGAPYR
jgi:hypothetical protein